MGGERALLVNWRALAVWFVGAVACVVVAGVAFGLVSSLLNPHPTDGGVRDVLAGGLMIGGLALSLVIMGLPFLALSLVCWALLVRNHPRLEASRLTLLVGLCFFAGLICIALLVAFPALQFGTPWLLIVFVFSALVAPRLALFRLRPGVFAAQQGAAADERQ